jgi:hypothetical protein
MTRHDYKAIYAQGNADWRIVYTMNGTWALQEFSPLPKGTDLRTQQQWKTWNTHMGYGDAQRALATYAKKVG